MNEVWVVIDYEEQSGSEAIKAIYTTKENAKLFLADYVLNNDCSSGYLEVVKKKVEV